MPTGILVCKSNGWNAPYERWLSELLNLDTYTTRVTSNEEVQQISDGRGWLAQKILRPKLLDRFEFAFWNPPKEADYIISSGATTPPLREYSNQYRIGLIHGVRAPLFGFRQQPTEGGKIGIKRVIQQGVRQWTRQQDSLSFSRMDTLVANSKFTANQMKEYYDVSVDEIIRPPVDTDSYEPQEKSDYYLYLGRLTATKGVENIAQAFSELGNEYQLKIAGKGPAYDTVENIAGDNVDLLGFVSEKKKRELFAEAKGFIQNTVGEPFGMTTIEAMASGTPVIAVKDGNNPNLVTHGETGILFNREVPEPFAPIKSTRPLKMAIEQSETIEWDRDVLISTAREFDQSLSAEQWKSVTDSI